MLSNTGSAALRIDEITVALPFLQTNTCGSRLAAGANCTIDVSFAPSATGEFSSKVSITDNAKGSPHTVALSGTGIDAPPPPPPPACTPIGQRCGPGLPRCCSPGIPHVSFCSSRTGYGICVMA